MKKISTQVFIMVQFTENEKQQLYELFDRINNIQVQDLIQNLRKPGFADEDMLSTAIFLEEQFKKLGEIKQTQQLSEEEYSRIIRLLDGRLSLLRSLADIYTRNKYKSLCIVRLNEIISSLELFALYVLTPSKSALSSSKRIDLISYSFRETESSLQKQNDEIIASFTAEHLDIFKGHIQSLYTQLNNLISHFSLTEPCLLHKIQERFSLLIESNNEPTPKDAQDFSDIINGQEFAELIKTINNRSELCSIPIYSFKSLIHRLTHCIKVINVAVKSYETTEALVEFGNILEKCQLQLPSQSQQPPTPVLRSTQPGMQHTTRRPVSTKNELPAAVNIITANLIFGLGMMGGGTAVCILAILSSDPTLIAISASAVVLGALGVAYTNGFFSKKSEQKAPTTTDEHSNSCVC